MVLFSSCGRSSAALLLLCAVAAVAADQDNVDLLRGLMVTTSSTSASTASTSSGDGDVCTAPPDASTLGEPTNDGGGYESSSDIEDMYESRRRLYGDDSEYLFVELTEEEERALWLEDEARRALTDEAELRAEEEAAAQEEFQGRELGWGDWSDADSWWWYFFGGGTDVPLTMTGWEPEIRALWMSLHGRTLLADVCAGKTSGSFSVTRWQSIWNLGVTWIGGFRLTWTATYLGTVKVGTKCYKKYSVTVTFADHFDCDPGGGNTYWVKHKWNFKAYCATPCPTTTTTTTTTTTSTTQSSTTQSSTGTTSKEGSSTSSYYIKSTYAG